MAGYVKLFSRIVDSSIWDESKDTKLMWITLLAKSDPAGYVYATDHSLAINARLTDEEACKALLVLQTPDPKSTCPDHDGRRIEKIQGGYFIHRYVHYRDFFLEDEKRESARQRKENQRAREKQSLIDGSHKKSQKVTYPSGDGYGPGPGPGSGSGNRGSGGKVPTFGTNTSENAVKISAKHFSEFWERYPVKQGETKAKRFFFLSVKTENDVWAIHQALGHYLASDKVERGFILNGDKWLEDWKVWQNPTAEMMVDREKLAEYRAREKEEREAAEWAKRKDKEHGISPNGK